MSILDWIDRNVRGTGKKSATREWMGSNPHEWNAETAAEASKANSLEKSKLSRKWYFFWLI